jgi:hypothetical protein
VKLNWFAKHSAHPSPPRTWLRLLGHSWSASPARRLVQGAFFALFLALFFWAAWPHGTGTPAQVRARRELIDIELFLMLDPLVSISAAIAGRVPSYFNCLVRTTPATGKHTSSVPKNT